MKTKALIETIITVKSANPCNCREREEQFKPQYNSFVQQSNTQVYFTDVEFVYSIIYRTPLQINRK